MKKILSALLAATLFFATTAYGASTGRHVPPACYADVEELPIHILAVATRYTDADGNEVTSSSRGTIWLADNNFWVTAAHVVSYGKNVTHTLIKLEPDLALAAKIVYIDAEKDVAVLYAESGDLVPLNAMTSLLKRNEPLWNVGFPGIGGNVMISFEGSTLMINSQGALVSSGMVMPGMSGGPQLRCLDGRLEAIAVLTSFPSVTNSEVHYINEETGATTVVRTTTNTGGSFSTPHVIDFVLEGMIARLDQLDEQKKQLLKQNQ